MKRGGYLKRNTPLRAKSGFLPKNPVKRKIGGNKAKPLSKLKKDLWELCKQLLAIEQCQICKVPFSKMVKGSRHIDHDHTTGAARGALSKWCNIGLGNFKDSPELLLYAAEYLKQAQLSGGIITFTK